MTTPRASNDSPDSQRPQVTMKMLAEACGVSIGAVSQCLRNPEHRRFSKETRERIIAKANELNYIPNRLAAGLRAGRSQYLSLVVPWNTPETLDAAELEARAHGYGLSIHFTAGSDLDAERKALCYGLGQRVDGLIWLPSDTAWDYARTLKQLRRSGTPTVFLEVALPGLPEAGLVEVNYESSLRKVMRGFLKTGCEKLILFTPGASHQMRARRAAVFDKFCRKHGVCGEIVVVGSEPEVVEQTLAAISTRCGVICEGDWTGLDVIRFAEKTGLRFPGDIQLVAVGDMLIGRRFRVGEICRPSYSAIRRPSGEMAREAVRILIQAVENPGGSLPRKTLRSEFVQRDTSTI